MERIEKGGKASYTFESPEDLKAFIINAPEDGESREERDSGFCPYSWDESIAALDRGWDGTDGVVEKVEALALGLKEGLGLDYRWDVVGQMVDVGTFVTGNPECWLEADPIETPKETISIKVNCSTPGSTSAKSIEHRGAVITALIDALYSKYFIDITFEITGGSVCGEKDIQAIFKLNTKNGYSRNMVAFYAAHPALLRRFFFATCEIELERNSCGGYGSSTEVSKKGVDIVFPELKHGETSKYETIESSQKELKRILKKVLKIGLA